MLNETEFHRQADQVLASLMDAIEAADSEAVLDCELDGASLTIDLPDGRQYLVSKHATSGQVWVASPISGGLHFVHSAGSWLLKDGRELNALVMAELKILAGIA